MNFRFFLMFVVCTTSCLNGNNENTNLVKKELETGKDIFLKHCSECHHKSMKIEMTAPALNSAVKKRTTEWLKHYILKGSEIAYSEGDSIALELRSQNWGAMPSFSFLSNDEIDNVISYVNYISEKKDTLY